MKLEEHFSKQEVELARKLFTFFHDKYFFVEEVKNPDAVLLVIYMASNKNKKAEVCYSNCLDLFCKTGKKKKEFSKALYELTKRSGRFLDTKGSGDKAIFSLNLQGLKRIKRILSQNGKANRSS